MRRPVVVHHDRPVAADPGPAHRRLEDRRLGQRVPAARAGRCGQVGVQVDVRRARDVTGGVLPGSGRPAHPVADVQDASRRADSRLSSVRSSAAETSGPVMRSSCRSPAVKGSRPVAELHFFTGTMDSGKSTLALQTNHNHAARGRIGRIFTTLDRAGAAVLSSRLGLTHDAIEVDDDVRLLDLRRADPHPGRTDRLPDLRRGPVLHARPDRPARQDRRRAPDRRVRVRHPHRLPQRALRRQRPAGRAGGPAQLPAGRGAVLVRQARHPQRPHRERRHGRRGRRDRGRATSSSRTRSRPTWPTRCCAASTTGAGSRRPARRRSAWRPSRCRSADRSRVAARATRWSIEPGDRRPRDGCRDPTSAVRRPASGSASPRA